MQRYELEMEGVRTNPFYRKDGKANEEEGNEESGLAIISFPQKNVSFFLVNFAVCEADSAAFSYHLLRVITKL